MSETAIHILKQFVNENYGIEKDIQFIIYVKMIIRPLVEDLLNEEILEYLDSGYNLQDDYVKTLRGMIKKLGLKELYNFNKYIKEL